MSRFTVKIAGESGQGINSTGDIVAKALKQSGYHVLGYREYPSLIKGGNASYQIEISDENIQAPWSTCSVLMCVSRAAVHEYLPTLANEGVLVHNLPRMQFSEDETKDIQRRQLQVHFVDTNVIASAASAGALQSNVICAGLLWAVLGLNSESLVAEVEKQFSHKPEFVEMNKKCTLAGYEYQWPSGKPQTDFRVNVDPNWKNSYYIKGNEALSLGAVTAGARAFYGYPMTPSSPILTYLAETAKQTGMLVKQAEDEITAAQMATGSMFAGTRAFTATSGGGFDLMTETVSLSGMTETPLMIVLGQRPGPATGMPTWTAAGDLELAIYAGHGEFPRCVIAASDIKSVYELTQEAFNLAESYQIPVILLTDKYLAETDFNVAALGDEVKIRRGILSDEELDQKRHDVHRYQVTETGVSLRWLPGQSPATYVGNSDEHDKDGNVVEDAALSAQMQAKRMRKLLTLKQNIPEPELIGDYRAKQVLVTWGTTKCAVADAFAEMSGAQREKWQWLHYEYIFPLRTTKLDALAKNGKTFVLLENNATGQFGKLVTQQTGIQFAQKHLKYDGRPFWADEVLRSLN
jgi:2-oxoglutarate/2-oxoacid ferredoxin oxidoreductase subunit alpha